EIQLHTFKAQSILPSTIVFRQSIDECRKCGWGLSGIAVSVPILIQARRRIYAQKMIKPLNSDGLSHDQQAGIRSRGDIRKGYQLVLGNAKIEAGAPV